MKKVLFLFIATIFTVSQAFSQTTSSSLPANTFIPQATPQSMYGLSGQQFVPQINITGSSSGIKIDTPYLEKRNNPTLEKDSNSDDENKTIEPVLEHEAN